MLCHDINCLCYFSDSKMSHFRTVAAPHTQTGQTGACNPGRCCSHSAWDCKLHQKGVCIWSKAFSRVLLALRIEAISGITSPLLSFCCLPPELGVSYGSVHSYLAAVRHVHIMCRHSDLSLLLSPCLGYMLKGLHW